MKVGSLHYCWLSFYDLYLFRAGDNYVQALASGYSLGRRGELTSWWR